MRSNGLGLPVAITLTGGEVSDVKGYAPVMYEPGPKPKVVIADKGYDSDSLDERLSSERGVELIAPHRSNRSRPRTQDGRPLRRYKRRWKIERLFAWLQNFRRLVVRYEYHAENFLAMVHLGCIVILLRQF